MEVAKVTSKGQITIPISIRRKLEINEGDKVLFIYKPEGVLMVNPTTYQAGADSSAPEVAETKAPAMTAKVTQPAVAAALQSTDSIPAEEAAVEEDIVPEVTARPVPPPVEDPEKPEPSVGGLNLGSLLDDIRSIGSNI